MILWTATSGCIQYYYAGKLGWKFLLYFVGFGFISGQLGQRLVNKVYPSRAHPQGTRTLTANPPMQVLRMTGRPSYVVLLLGGIIVLACAAMTGTGIYKVGLTHHRRDATPTHTMLLLLGVHLCQGRRASLRIHNS